MARATLSQQIEETEKIKSAVGSHGERIDSLTVTIKDVEDALNKRLSGTEKLVNFGFLVIVLTSAGVVIALIGLIFDFYYFKFSDKVETSSDSSEIINMYITVNDSNSATTSEHKFKFAE